MSVLYLQTTLYHVQSIRIHMDEYLTKEMVVRKYYIYIVYDIQ